MMPDTSPQNLRKFLKSDDLALVRMGLSLAKGVEVPDEMLIEIIWMYMFHDDKTIRAAAKSTFIKLAPEDAKQVVKQNWRASYRTEYGPQLGVLGKALCQTSVSLVEPLILALSDVNRGWRLAAAVALGKIGDARAVKPLIKALGDEVNEFHHRSKVRTSAAEALGKIGDERAVEPLIKMLSDEDSEVRSYAFKALGKIGDARAVQPLIEILGDNRLSVIKAAAGALGMIGDARAVKPLFKTFENENLGLIKVTAKTIVKIKGSDIEDEERKNVLKFLKSKDPAMVRMGASMLKGILEERSKTPPRTCANFF